MAVKWLNELFTIAILGSKDIILFKFYYSPNVEVKDFKFKTNIVLSDLGHDEQWELINQTFCISSKTRPWSLSPLKLIQKTHKFHF